MSGPNGHTPSPGGRENGHLRARTGAKPATKAEAKAEAKATRELVAAKHAALDAATRYGVLVDIGPADEGLLEAYAESCGLVEFWRREVGQLAAATKPREVGGVEMPRLMGKGPGGAEAVHPFVEMHRLALEQKAKFAVWCIKANIDEKRLRLEAARAETVFTVMREAAADANLSPGQQKALLAAFGQRIRELVAG